MFSFLNFENWVYGNACATIQCCLHNVWWILRYLKASNLMNKLCWLSTCWSPWTCPIVISLKYHLAFIKAESKYRSGCQSKFILQFQDQILFTSLKQVIPLKPVKYFCKICSWSKQSDLLLLLIKFLSTEPQQSLTDVKLSSCWMVNTSCSLENCCSLRWASLKWGLNLLI